MRHSAERIDLGAQTGQLPASLDLDAAESPRFTGRAVVALAADPGRSAFTGRAVAVRDLAEHYAFPDLDGRLPPGPLRHRSA